MGMFMITSTNTLLDNVTPLAAVDVASLEEATMRFGEALSQYMEDGETAMEIMDEWKEKCLRPVCGCGNPECNNIVMVLSTYPEYFTAICAVYLPEV